MKNTAKCKPILELIYHMLNGLLKPEFADQGDSRSTNEKAAYIYFVDFVDECEGRIFLAITTFTIDFFWVACLMLEI